MVDFILISLAFVLMASADSKEKSPPLKKKRLSTNQENVTGFPDSLEGFGYRFIDGRLCDITTGSSFEFEARRGDQAYNQKRYEALGEVITEYVYGLLMSEGKLVKKSIPIDASENKPSTFIFHSEDAFTNSKLIVLIHGSGVVRAGQWSRRLIINDGLNSGTQLPFIQKAQDLGYGVIVLNTNDNYSVINGKKLPIKGSEDPDSHAHYVWKHIISKTDAKHIAIIAHSFGGVVTVNLCRSFLEDFQNRVFAVALTDSVHSLANQRASLSVNFWLRKVGRNWVGSNEPLDTPVTRCTQSEIECVSAGTKTHELTSWTSFASIFQFVEERLRERLRDNDLRDKCIQ